MTDLPNDIESLKALIVQLLAENAQLKAENAELRRRLGMDSMDSHNSDKPPKQGLNVFATLRDLFAHRLVLLA
jgi:regulator of replication initiation timing